MAAIDYPKYQILLHPGSKKIQGLRTGDVVRRQYYDGGSVYSLMCVLDHGTERTQDSETGLYEEQPYFIGALLEGDAPASNELLDFARVTNLFDENRSGALYLTASDSEAPYMDVIDGIGRERSLCWPENIAAEDFEDPQSQYIVKGTENLNVRYSPFSDGRSRILTVTRMDECGEGFEGLQQDFFQYVTRQQEIIVSYKIRSSQPLTVNASLSYKDGLRTDALWEEESDEDWRYVFRMATIEYSGRHLRTFKIDFSGLEVGEEIQIADFNIILLSSISEYARSSVSRIGKLDGITDNVFGKLEGYGAYLQKLYATNAAHVSGTLTAGDENGFGATFYAGRIHRNCFVNSTDVNFVSSITIVDNAVENPTGIGHIYLIDQAKTMYGQSSGWLSEHAGQRYCFSCWTYVKKPCAIGITQNGHAVGSVNVVQGQTHKWRRVHVCFDLIEEDEDLRIGFAPRYEVSDFDTIPGADANLDEEVFYFTAPQLEKGGVPSQYQPTDYKLDYTDDFGAWMARGGFGGTIQNPLLKLNYDGEGSIGTRNRSIELKQDGSGHLANHNIMWDKGGKVTFGKGVTLNWSNLDGDTQDELAGRSIKIIGEDTFSMAQTEDGEPYFAPSHIALTLVESNFRSSSSQRKWYYRDGDEFVLIEGENSLTLEVMPDSDYWNGSSALVIKSEVEIREGYVLTDSFTIRRQYVEGISLVITSSNGTVFRNGECQTVLTAHVYINGELVDDDEAAERYTFTWYKYDSENPENPPVEVTDNETNTLTLDYSLQSSDRYGCVISSDNCFPYEFPAELG